MAERSKAEIEKKKKKKKKKKKGYLCGKYGYGVWHDLVSGNVLYDLNASARKG